MSTIWQNVPWSQRQRAVLLDSGAILGFYNTRDQWHEQATQGFSRLAAEHRLLCATDLVVAESYSLLLQRVGEPVARAWLSFTDTYAVVYHTPQHHSTVVDFLQRYQGRGYSYVDAFSFVTMEAQGLRLAFTFDRHFQDYGWEVFPGPLP
ncbi:MAG: type II toxin-antitoxin system VapC family toxin [Chloroflexi bacterium]|nr:type II toxin-antitoxin system VapC family toxin [Chloroflexota bacterium]